MSTIARTAARAPRVAWVDYSKGICIFLVVMLHANLSVQDVRGATGWLEYVVAFARPFRMPDFFLIAGLFLSNTIDRPWRTYLDKKVVHFVYFYVLWASAQYFLFNARAALSAGSTPQQVALDYLMIFVEPLGSLWFIHSLALFFVVIRITRRVPWWLMLAIAGGLQCADINTGWTAIDEFTRRFVYFYSGYFLAPHVFRLADWALAHRRGLFGYLLVWGVINQALVAAGWSKVAGVGLALGYVGAVAVVFLGVLFSQMPATSGLRRLGENSIVVYLGYYACEQIALKCRVGHIPDIGSAALVLTLCSVGGALVLFWALMRAGVTFPYRRPAWARLSVSPRPVVGAAAAES